jgi:hypothetical protein
VKVGENDKKNEQIGIESLFPHFTVKNPPPKTVKNPPPKQEEKPKEPSNKNK